MSLQVGIVGLPNVGKSTLFNALLKKQQAYVANFPFATIEPNVGVVPVPDERLEQLAKIVETEKIVPATVEFVDIAGLIKGASQGEGLGNKFLAHIREVDAIAHVVRVFSDPDVVKQGVTEPVSDYQTIKMELELADLESLERQEKKKDKDKVQVPKLSEKPVILVLNVDEQKLVKSKEIGTEYAAKLEMNPENIVVVSAKTEAELAELTRDEQREYLRELGIEEQPLSRLIDAAYRTLGLISFLTAGKKEVRAWTIKNGMTAQSAAGVIHTDFVKKFIAAKVCRYSDFVKAGGWKSAAAGGLVRQEGRDYVMQADDVVEFMIGS